MRCWTPRVSRPSRFEDCAIPANLSDKKAAEHVWKTLALPLTTPESMYGLRRNQDNNLTFPFFFENGISNITVLKKENRLRIETHRNSLWGISTTSTKRPS